MRRILFIVFLVVVAFLSGVCRSEEEIVAQRFSVEASDPKTVITVIENFLSEKGDAVYDPATGGIIVVDYPSKLREVAEIIRKLDRPRKQVQVSVVIADVTESFLQNVGLKGADARVPAVRIDAALSSLERRKDARIRSQATVTTMSNYPARIQGTRDIIIGESAVIMSRVP